MTTLKRTPLYDRHVALGATMVEFAGWEMPLHYPTGIVEEHLATRKSAGLFDVSHMGRFYLRGAGALSFLQHVLSNNAETLSAPDVGALYNFIPNETGGAVDDAFLYRFVEDAYMLVVNAANRQKDWDHLRTYLGGFDDVGLIDRTAELTMFALQGPASRDVLAACLDAGRLPEPMRNAVGIVQVAGADVMVSRTGYTGEPICFEIFVPSTHGPVLWDRLIEKGATPVGLGARDTLRLEAGLPLYGHELGLDAEGREIPIMACPQAKFAVSFSPLKGDFVGREVLERQFAAFKRILFADFSDNVDLPRMIRPVAVTGRGVAREKAKVFKDGNQVGFVTSGTRVPYWIMEGEGLSGVQTDRRALRSICLAYIDSDIMDDEPVSVDIRGKAVDAVVAPFHLRSEAPPYARPIVYDHEAAKPVDVTAGTRRKVSSLLKKTLKNTLWRQQECINLIPSEMTPSPMVRLVSVMDPAFRYAEHKKVKAFYDTDVFYYQGTDFIEEVEMLLEAEMVKYLGCEEAELRVVSGQMANAAVFSGLVDYLNRADRKSEPRRIRQVMNHYIGKGGHLSAQPMGALRDFVARDPHTERPAAVNFPVLPHNPFQIDVPAAFDMIAQYRPELIIFGKSMVLHKEPVAEIRRFVDEQRLGAFILYDMAHVLGLVGPHFQEPFREGAHLVTGSTHKTYFGTQRGVIGSPFLEQEERYELWEAIRRRSFPGAVSNHHLGTLLGLLMAAYEMNQFAHEYQAKVMANAKAFARALKDCGLAVLGDSDIDFTETHQVLLSVGYGRGPEMARRLEKNNIICNYQAAPDEEGFTAAGALRMGVAEMTRFGMEAPDFQAIAPLMRDVITHNADVKETVKSLRARFRNLQFCFRDDEYVPLVQKLQESLRF